MQDRQYDELQKRIDNLALALVELIRTVEAMKVVMDNRKSTCSCNKTVDKDAISTQESSGDCKIDSRRDKLNKELYDKFKKSCDVCRYNTHIDSVIIYGKCLHRNKLGMWVSK